MKRAKLVHNPGAGDGEHAPKHLRDLIEAKGFTVDYASTKEKGWKEMDDETEIVIVAGGDGTVKKVVISLLDKALHQNRPIALIPSGTANNIAKTLGITGEAEDIIESWHLNKLRKFSVGKIVDETNRFFLESVGFGVFPTLIEQMEQAGEVEDPQEAIILARKLLKEMTEHAAFISCEMNIDGKDFSGKYVLIEVMNTKTIGPNLVLAPDAEPGDEWLEVILVDEDRLPLFLSYLNQLAEMKEVANPVAPIRGKKISIHWTGKSMHIDDKVVLSPGRTMQISLLHHLVNFLV